MNAAAFVLRFPEFGPTYTAQPTFVQAVLDDAALELDANVWGDLYDSGHGYLTAHKLALSPFGQQAKLVAKDGSTTYEKHFQRLQRIVTLGGRVA